MNQLPILTISRTSYYADASENVLINIADPSDTIPIKPFPKEIMPVEVIYFDEKRQKRYFPTKSDGKVPDHVMLYKFPRLDELSQLSIPGTGADQLHIQPIVIAERYPPARRLQLQKKAPTNKRGIKRRQP